MISATLARQRAIDAMIERARQAQLAFYAMLEQRYGAIRGDEDSYLVAMERYDYDMEKERKKREASEHLVAKLCRSHSSLHIADNLSDRVHVCFLLYYRSTLPKF